MENVTCLSHLIDGPGHGAYTSNVTALPPLFKRLPRNPQERVLGDKRNLKDLTYQEMEEFFREIGEPKYRARQVFAWIYARGVEDFACMTDLSRKLRDKLEQTAVLPSLTTRTVAESEAGDTTKYLFDLPQGGEVESVQMRYLEEMGPGRLAVCISSQVGCAMGCNFCASGVAGLKRHLSTWEIVEQVTRIQNALRPRNERVANVVFMGLGEPLHNYDEVLRAARLLNHAHGLNIGIRHLTISTSGLVPQIDQLAEEGLPIRLAISLHAVRDELRSEIMPVNRRWKLEELMKACARYFLKTRRRITFEYILLDGVNDSREEAAELARLLNDHQIHSLVNLIPWNPVDGVSYQRSKPENIRAFQSIVEQNGIKCTVRREKGADIDAACGQLRLRNLKSR